MWCRVEAAEGLHRAWRHWVAAGGAKLAAPAGKAASLATSATTPGASAPFIRSTVVFGAANARFQAYVRDVPLVVPSTGHVLWWFGS